VKRVEEVNEEDFLRFGLCERVGERRERKEEGRRIILLFVVIIVVVMQEQITKKL